MHTGNVRWFDQRRGYGFIQPADGYRDIFVHRSALARAGLARPPFVTTSKITT